MEHEAWNDRLEIEGDLWAELEAIETTDADIDAHYLDWCERQANLVLAGLGLDPSGELVNVWEFA